MNEIHKERWELRLENFGKALYQLQKACERETYTELEGLGLVKTFEVSYELAWKTLKDLLAYEGYDAESPRGVFRESFEARYLEENDCETFLDALDRRNRLSHTYNESLALEATKLIRTRYLPALLKLHQRLDSERAR